MHKPRNQLLRGYEPDPVPPPTVCAKAQRPPPADGKAVTASPRDGWSTADEGPRGQQSAQAQATRNLPNWATQPGRLMACGTGQALAVPQPPGIYTMGRSQRHAQLPLAVPSAARKPGHFPPPHRGRSRACADTAAPWVPRGCPPAPPGPRHASAILSRSRPFGPRAPSPRLARECQGSPRSPLQATAMA